MTKRQATDLYISKSPDAQRLIDCIERWNPKMTIRENTERIAGMTWGQGQYLAKRFGLKFQAVQLALVPVDAPKNGRIRFIHAAQS